MIINKSAKTQALAYLVGNDTTVESLILRLFSNNAIITEDTLSTDVVEVSSTNGYSSKPLQGSSWIISDTLATYPLQQWTFTNPLGNIYGYYVTNTTGTLLLAETFSSGPYNIQTNGDTISVTLNLNLL